jgi:hypothetical protein
MSRKIHLQLMSDMLFRKSYEFRDWYYLQMSDRALNVK